MYNTGDMEEFGKIVSIAVGGALGAVARYLTNISPLGVVFDKFPFPTFVINVTGSFLIGVFMILFADRFSSNDNLRTAIVVGFIGAFTTFSTFEMEIFGLVKEKQLFTAFLYLSLSVVVGFLGVIAGVSLGRRIV